MYRSINGQLGPHPSRAVLETSDHITQAANEMRWVEIIGLAENLLRGENLFSAGFSRLMVAVLGEPKTNGGAR